MSTEAEATEAEAGQEQNQTETTETTTEATESFDWRAGLTADMESGDAKKFSKQLDSMESLGAVGVRLREIQKQFDGRVAIPGDDADDEARDAFAAKIGWNADLEAYSKAQERPEFVNELMTPEGAGEIEKLFYAKAHEMRMPKQHADGAISAYYGLLDEQERAKEERGEEMAKATEASLKELYGDDYQPNMQLAKRYAETVGADNLLDVQLADGGTIGDLAPVVRAMIQAGRSTLDESNAPPAVMSDEARQSLQETYDGMIAKVGTAEYATPAFQAKLRKVAEQLYGTDPIAGEPV